MILIISNSRDYGTDEVIRRLQSLGCEYHRLDSDLLHHDEVVLDPRSLSMKMRQSVIEFSVAPAVENCAW